MGRHECDGCVVSTKKPLITKTQREERWRTCARYIAQGGDIPSGQLLVKKDGVSFNTSVWISALGKLLEQVMKNKIAKGKS